ncbi:AAA family ATPase [Kitasatospora sp. NPDC127060]|uniref:AAA family ATPase n=1 Tax=Kitasatospora sp. NPDC127060 TaxID=3347121 RepID=UPI0036559855
MATEHVVPKVRQARYAAPRVTVTPVEAVISTEPIDKSGWAGHYQQIHLDTATGQLTFFESPQHLEPQNAVWTSASDVPAETWARWYPGRPFTRTGPHMWFNPVPRLLTWTIDSGVKELPYLGVPQANALLAELAPHAQRLLDMLFQAGADLDWSAAAARAGRDIHALCSRERRTTAAGAHADLVDYADIVATFPQVYQPELLAVDRSRLVSACESITRYLPGRQEITKVFGRPAHDGTCVLLDVLGARSWYLTARSTVPRPAPEPTAHRRDGIDTAGTAATRRALTALGLPENCLLVLIGISGSGKSTLARLFAGSVLNADRLREALTGDPLDQSVSTAAWELLYGRLDSMLRERRPVIVDAVNSEAWVRKKVIAAAQLHGIPAVALVVDATLKGALARNAERPAALRVRDQVVTAQHDELTRDLPGLLAEGFTAVHHTRDLPVMTAFLRRCAEREKAHPALHIERTFGPDLAPLFTRHDGQDDHGLRTGAFGIGGHELTIRWADQDDPDEVVHQLHIPCPDCGEPAWVNVHSATDLLDASNGTYPTQATCLCL